MRTISFLAIIFYAFLLSGTTMAQEDATKYEYVYVKFRKKYAQKEFKVKIDMENDENEAKLADELTKELSNNNSYALCINHMSTLGYEFINGESDEYMSTLDMIFHYLTLKLWVPYSGKIYLFRKKV